MSTFRHHLHRIAMAALGAALVACLANPASEGGEQDAGASTREGEIEGTAVVHVARYKDNSQTLYYLQTKGGQFVRVFFPSKETTPLIQTGEYLKLAGSWNGKSSHGDATFTATPEGIIKHAGVHHEEPGVGEAPNGSRDPLVHRVAVIMLGSSKYTKEQALAQVTPGRGSAASFIGENSGGIDSVEGVVWGPYTNVDTSDCSNRVYQIADLAIRAAAADGKDPSKYNKLAFLLPEGANCGWGGLGQVGSPGSTRQLRTWYNNWFDCGVVAHELGHNLGLLHAHSTSCGNAVYSANRSGCSDSEYGDPFDDMGRGGCTGHYSTPQKQYMGWFENCEDLTAGGSATFNLSPSEGTCGARSLRIPIAGESTYYYLEYRKKISEFSGAAGGNHVIVSASDDGATVRPNLYRLDGTPGTSSGHGDGWLTVGASYSLPGNVQIRVLTEGALAQVQITMPQSGGAKCHNGESPVVDPSGGVGSVCGSGDLCPDDPNKTAPGFCGCGVPDVDTDGDGERDCTDKCPLDPNKIVPGECDCGKTELECKGTEAGLIRTHYSGAWSTLPDFAALTPDEKPVVVDAINVTSYAGKDYFGVVFTGGVKINQAGTYQFELSSDDGSRLLIDDNEVVDNDGLHASLTKTGIINNLSAGQHAIRVEFFEYNGLETLRLRYRTPGSAAFAEIPAALLVHSTTGGDGPVITASGENKPHVAKNAFDKDNATKWATSGTSRWIQYQYAGTEKKLVRRYTITSAGDSPGSDPMNFSLLGSNDGTNWTLLSTRTGVLFSSRGQRRSSTFINTSAFRMYRLEIKATWDGNPAGTAQLAEFGLWPAVTTP